MNVHTILFSFHLQENILKETISNNFQSTKCVSENEHFSHVREFKNFI